MLGQGVTHSSPHLNGRKIHQWHRGELSYCSNVHPGQSLTEVCENIAQYSAGVRQRRHLTSMHSGLWLSEQAATALQDPGRLRHFKRTLDQNGITLSSLNGFPYGDFHQQQLKADVYLPDWSMPERLRYTQQLAKVLAFCLPDHCCQGSISTLPLGYRSHWSAEKHQQSLNQLIQLNQFLHRLYRESGKSILICIEMEPDCVLDKTGDLVQFFNHFKELLQHQHPAQPCYLACCFDVCHQAVMFESAQDALQQITDAGIEIGKIQLSSALRLSRPHSLNNASLQQLLAQFSEPRYLHQVQIKQGQNIWQYADLPEALQALDNSDHTSEMDEDWRIHFHVPIHESRLAETLLSTTQAQLIDVFDQLAIWPSDRHKPFLEVETYTWQVLPKHLQPQNNEQLMDGIYKEIQWVEQHLKKRALLSDEP